MRPFEVTAHDLSHVAIAPAELSEQHRFGEPPITRYGIRRDLQDNGCLFNSQASEEPQLNDSALALVHARERVKGLVNGDEIVSVLVRDRQSLVERDAYRRPAAFLIALRSGRIDEDAPYQPRCHGEEVRAILPADVVHVEQTDVGLVDERRGLETVTYPLARHEVTRNPMQLGVDDRDQTLQRFVVAVAPCFEQPCDVV
jgi:hypothetical protein